MSRYNEVSLEWEADGHGRIRIDQPDDITISSAEYLPLAAIGLRFMEAFFEHARQEQLYVRRYATQVSGLLERTSAGPTFRAYTLHVRIVVPEQDRARAERLLGQVQRRWSDGYDSSVPVDIYPEVLASRPSSRADQPRSVA